MKSLEEAAPVRPTTAPEGRAMHFLLVLGTASAVAGEVVFLRIVPNSPDEGFMQALGGALLTAGALLFGFATRRASMAPARLEFPREDVSRPAFHYWDRWAAGWLLAAIALSAGAIGLFMRSGETPIVVVMWLASIAALFAAQVRRFRFQRPRVTREGLLHFGILAALLVVATIMRAYALTTLPHNFDGDFASVGLQARAIATGQEQRIFAYGWAAIPMLGYYPAAITMALFGTGLAGLNSSGVIEGLLMIVGIYLLGRDLFHPRVGLIGAALMTVSYAQLAASRQACYIDPVVFLVFAVYFFIVGLREGRWGATVTSGLLTALCIQTYYSGRIAIFIVGFMVVYLLVFRRAWLRSRGWTVALWALAVLIALGPMLVVFARDFDGFMSRTREVFILSPEIVKHMQGVYHVTTVPEMLLQQLRHTALMFNYYTDSSTQFGFRRPFLDPFTMTLFVLGIGFALFQWRRFGAALILAWTVLGLLVGCFLTANAPFWPRLLILLPPVALLPALAIDAIYERMKRGLERIGNAAGLLVPAALAAILIVVGISNWNTYVEVKGTYATARTDIGRYLMDQPASTSGYLVSQDMGFRDREFEFLAPGRLVSDLKPEQITRDIPRVGRPTVLILTQEQSKLMETLPRIFSGGTAEIHAGNSPDEVAFYVFRLP